MFARYYPRILAMLVILSVVIGFMTAGFVQTIAFVGAGILASWLTVTEVSQQRLVVRILIGLGTFLLLFLAVNYVARRFSTAPQSYPREDGLIADFASGPGGPARSALGTQFSLLSDSVWNVSSKIWYQRVDGSEPSDNGFLRISYELEPSTSNSFQPYVGVYVDFSTPPPIQYDVSRFRQLSLRLRSEPSANSAGIDVGVILT